ncbi:acyl-CoA dehydrogenase [Saccharopolyspora gloriosae]|uniref:acyl-CoA dehydrogenase n=1 Tax=Saccharopolyspora gloriosae TaxID=455344 RepID=UPI001FB6285C|nr:acyl-CoA dehydrogenase [Saccharopolyspora gloriosae]
MVELGVENGEEIGRAFDRPVLALRRLVEAGALDFPFPGEGDTRRRWSLLAAHGRRDLSLARLVEGHTDAAAILHEAGRKPVPGAVYGVWASRAGGEGAVSDDSRGVLTGTVPMCSGAATVDRALLVARPGSAQDATRDVLLDIAVDPATARPVAGSWQAAGMADSETLDVVLRDLPWSEESVVAAPGFYTERPGFWLGGAGVGAVWFGGVLGLWDSVVANLRTSRADPHKLAQLGALRLAVEQADAVLTRAVDEIDAATAPAARALARRCRCAAESAARQALDLSPRITGPVAFARDAQLSRRLADLQVYVRQHSTERELADWGEQALDGDSGLGS